MQIILGANGVIGRELSTRLPQYSTRIRQVSRSPKPVNATDELFSADLLDPKATADAVAGSALVFFDNVYTYGRVNGVMTESTPYNPCSRKGEVRARIATTFMDEVTLGELRGAIVRAADFYGPDAALSVTHATVTERLKKGTPQWIGNPNAVHPFTYTRDAGRSLARVGNTPSALGQVWHALTSKEPITGEQYLRIACELAHRPYALQAVWIDRHNLPRRSRSNVRGLT